MKGVLFVDVTKVREKELRRNEKLLSKTRNYRTRGLYKARNLINLILHRMADYFAVAVTSSSAG